MVYSDEMFSQDKKHIAQALAMIKGATCELDKLLLFDKLFTTFRQFNSIIIQGKSRCNAIFIFV